MRKTQSWLYREPFEFAKCFTGICPLAPVSSQILTLAGITARRLQYVIIFHNHHFVLEIKQ